MHNGLDLQLQPVAQTSSPTMSEKNESPQVQQNSLAEWSGSFNTSLLTTRAQYTKDRSHEISDLIKTPEFESILFAAQNLAIKENLSQEEATERLINVFRRLDYTWKQTIVSRGLNSLINKSQS